MMKTKTVKVNKKKIQPMIADCIFVKRFGINMVFVEGFSCFMFQQQFKQ